MRRWWTALVALAGGFGVVAVGLTQGSAAAALAAGVGPASEAVEEAVASAFAVIVTPKDSAVSVRVDNAEDYVFIVENTEPDTTTYDLACSYTGVFANCSVQGQTQRAIPPNDVELVIVVGTPQTHTVGTGTVRLAATKTGYVTPTDTGSYDVTFYSLAGEPSVLPDDSTAKTFLSVETDSIRFRLTQAGPDGANYSLLCETGGALVFDPPEPCQDSLWLQPGADSMLWLSYGFQDTAGVQGNISVIASRDTLGPDTGTVNIEVITNSSKARVLPIGDSVIGGYGGSRTFLYRIYNDSAEAGNYDLAGCTVDEDPQDCSIPRDTIVIQGSSSVDTTVTATLPVSGASVPVSLTVAGVWTVDDSPDSARFVVTIPAPVDVTPKDSVIQVLAKRDTTLSFDVENEGITSEKYGLECYWTGGSCTLQSDSVTVAGGSSESVGVSLTAGADTASGDTLRLRARIDVDTVFQADSGSYLVTTYRAVDVTPKGDDLPIAVSADSTVQFMVENKMTYAVTYHIECWVPGSYPDSCTDAPDTVTIGAQTTGPVSATVVAGTQAGSGQVRLYALDTLGGTPQADTGWYNVTVSEEVQVTPKGQDTTLSVNNTNTVDFTVTNPSDVERNVRVQCSVMGVLATCTPVDDTITVDTGIGAPVSAQMWPMTDSSGTGELRLAATMIGAPVSSDTGWFDVSVIPTAGAPSVEPEEDTLVLLLPAQSLDTFTFTLTQSGEDPARYAITCADNPSGQVFLQPEPEVQCPDSLFLVPGVDSTLSVTFAHQNIDGGFGDIFVSAIRDTLGPATGHLHVELVQPVLVEPKDTAVTWYATRDTTMAFRVTNGTEEAKLYDLTCSKSSTEIGCSTPIDTVTVQPDDTVAVGVTFTASRGPRGPDTVWLKAQADGEPADSGSYRITSAPAVVVMPEGDSVVLPINDTTDLDFIVGNLSDAQRTFTLACTVDAAVATCSGVPDSLVLAAGGQPGSVDTVTATAAATGTTAVVPLQLSATTGEADSLQADTGSYILDVKLGASVTPKDSLVEVLANADVELDFKVHNEAAQQRDFVASCFDPDNVASCQIASDTITVPGEDSVTVEATVDPGPGGGGENGHVYLRISEGSAYDEGDYELDVWNAFPEVTPVDSMVTPGASMEVSFKFWVENTGAEAWTYDLDCEESGLGFQSGSCNVQGTLQLDPGERDSVWVSVDTRTSGQLSTLELIASTTGHGSAVADTGSYLATVTQNVDAPTIDLSPTPRDRLDYGGCVTAVAGPAGRFQCGALVLSHAMPAVKRLNKDQSLALVYNSVTAEPAPVIMFDLGEPPSGYQPDSVEVRVTIDGENTWRMVEAPTTWPVRMSVPVQELSTGVYTYEVRVEAFAADTSCDDCSTTESSRTAVIDRDGSMFGDGWWVGGVADLRIFDEMLLLSEADGSWAVYDSVAPGTFVAPPTMVQDTIRRTDYELPAWAPSTGEEPEGVHYVQRLKDGTVRLFHDTTGFGSPRAGRMTWLVAPTGQRAQFFWDSRLELICLPPWSDSTCTTGTSNKYVIDYGGWGDRLDDITDPVGRVLDVSVSSWSNRLTNLEDPDNESVHFSYSGNRIAERENKAGVDVSYGYHAGTPLLDSVWVPLNSSQTAVTAFAAVQTRGLSESDDLYQLPLSGEATSTVTDPRGNTTTFWVNQTLQPIKITDALSNSTTIAYDNIWRILPWKVSYPNGWTLKAAYDDRGNIESLTSNASSPSAITDYTYGDSNWPDSPTRVEQPEGGGVITSYNTDGTRSSVQAIGGGTTAFTYGTGAERGLVSTVTPPITPAESFAYDSLGNVSRWTNGLGDSTTYARDNVGRATAMVMPVSGSNTNTRAMGYDVMNRLLADTTIGASYSQDVGDTTVTPGTEQIVVSYDYDAVGNVLEVVESGSSDGGFSATAHYFGYDYANRQVLDSLEGAWGDSIVYDVAGNVYQEKKHGRPTVTMQYDELNRLTSRSYGAGETADSTSCTPSRQFPLDTVCAQVVFPVYPNSGTSLTISGFTDTLTYDEMGYLETANNPWAHVTRTYTRDGLISTDRLQIKDYAGSGFNTHDYTVSYAYDRNRRRKTMTMPTGFWKYGGDDVSYAYDNGTGQIRTIQGANGQTYTFDSDNQGRITGITYPGSITESLAYDDGSRLESREFSGSVLLDETLTYDDRNKLVSAVVGTGAQQETNEMAYSGLGMLRGSSYYRFTPLDARTTEVFTANVLGQVLDERTTVGTEYDPGAEREYSLTQGHLLTQTRDTVPDETGWFPDTLNVFYDDAGNQIWQARRRYHSVNLIPDQWGFTARRTYYDGANRVRYAQLWQVTSTEASTESRGAWEEYWYDALGRRVLKRERVDSLCNDAPDYCQSAVERYVWDGDNLLWEERIPGWDSLPADSLDMGHGWGDYYGEVMYTPGAIDRPLDVSKTNQNLASATAFFVPHVNWRGLFSVGTEEDGDDCKPSGGSCPNLDWPGNTRTAYLTRNVGATGLGIRFWYGGLVHEQQDASGLLYRRNRYYDPATGQFTQEDPIGIAGGLNLYGYAGGDPINFSDPFGLCIDDDAVCRQLVADLLANSKAADDVFAVTADWLEEWDSGRVLIGTEEEFPQLRSSFGTRYGLAPSSRQSDGNLYINSRQGRGDQLLVGVHEVAHERDVSHGPAMRAIELEAYNSLLPGFRASASRLYEYLRTWFGSSRVKRPGGG